MAKSPRAEPRSDTPRKRRKARRHRPGTPIGHLVSDPAAPATRIRMIAYGPDAIEERELDARLDVGPWLEKFPVVWIDIDGLGDANVFDALGQRFGLHRLALEDAMMVPQRAKIERWDEALFVVARMIHAGFGTEPEQVSLFIGDRFLVTIQEDPKSADPFDPVRERLRHGRGRSRRSGPDHLAWALIDVIIDNWVEEVDRYGDHLAELESQVLAGSGRAVIGDLHTVRRELLAVRRDVVPLREICSQLIRDPGDRITQETRIFLGDCHDHVIQAVELVEAYREINTGLMELHLSLTSARMNEVMKVLTVISTIFMPLSFVAGVYGMNFDTGFPWNMPELGWRYGYPIVLGMMFLLGAAMLAFFWRRGWLVDDETELLRQRATPRSRDPGSGDRPSP